MDIELKTASIAYETLRDKGIHCAEDRELADSLTAKYGWPTLSIYVPKDFKLDVLDTILEYLAYGCGEKLIQHTWTLTEQDMFAGNYCPDLSWIGPLDGRCCDWRIFTKVLGNLLQVTAIISQSIIKDVDVYRAAIL